MKSDWIVNSIFAGLASATFYFVQLGLEYGGVPRHWAVPLSVIASAIGVGVCVRYITTAIPLKLKKVRQCFLEESVLEGMWLEILNRRGKQHYSIVRFKYDPASQPSLSPCSAIRFSPTDVHIRSGIHGH